MGQTLTKGAGWVRKIFPKLMRRVDETLGDANPIQTYHFQKTGESMARDFNLHLQVADGHLRLVSRGNLNDLKIKQVLRAAEAGLHVFPVVVIDVQEAKGTTAEDFAMLEEGLRQIISKRKQVLLKTYGNGSPKKFSLLKNSSVGMAKV